MISLNTKNYKTYSKYFDNNSVDELINSYYFECATVDLSLYACPNCNHFDTMEHHAYYTRTIRINGIKYKIRILRVKCKHCGKTHAVLPSFIIPYIQTSLNDAFVIINKYKNNDDLIINEDYRIINSYKLWLNRLRSVFLSLKNKIETILLTCINKFQMYFLQTHRGKYFIFS